MKMFYWIKFQFETVKTSSVEQSHIQQIPKFPTLYSNVSHVSLLHNAYTSIQWNTNVKTAAVQIRKCVNIILTLNHKQQFSTFPKNNIISNTQICYVLIRAKLIGYKLMQNTCNLLSQSKQGINIHLHPIAHKPLDEQHKQGLKKKTRNMKAC